MVLAIGWQESCYRQFKVNKGKVTYLLSYNGTSVGIMQINERVWRGIYEQNSLRWNIHYNALAGSEIVELYFRKYALGRLKKDNPQKAIDNDTLAQLVYAMYNGGPGQFNKFFERKKSGRLFTSDNLFFEKYLWVKNNQFQNITRCLIGE